MIAASEPVKSVWVLEAWELKCQTRTLVAADKGVVPVPGDIEIVIFVVT